MQPVRWTLAAAVLGLTAIGARADDAPKGANPAAVAEVEAGKRTEAKASWWGFDPKESTTALQAAIDSKARKLIVEDMGSPWIVDEVKLRGDLEIVFEPGVVVQAKRGAFKGRNASLFTAVRAKNLILRGPGATLRMWRDDYDDPKQYDKAEWRHVIDLKSCENVQILGLTLAESGGDGIYLGVSGGGPNINVLIQDVVCDRNYRQGISVISARGLTIERCVLKNTAGTAPMAGIDFEPNHPREEITDCVMRDCLVENNAGGGYQFYLRPLDSTSKPVSVRLERCRSIGDRVGFGISSSSRTGAEPVGGEIVVVDSDFFDSQGAGISINGKPAGGVALRFERSRIIHPAAEKPELAPIVLGTRADDPEDAGGVTFVDCEIVDSIDRRPINFHDSFGGRKLVDVSGDLTVEHSDRRATHQIDQKLINDWFPTQAFRRFPPHPAADGPFEPVDAAKSKKEWSSNVRQRGKSEWLVWAEAGDEVVLTVNVQAVARGAEPPVTPITWISPSGKEEKLGKAEGGKLDLKFKATETGAQRIVCEPGSATVHIPKSNRPVAMIASGRLFHPFRHSGDLYFFVPKDTEAFALRVTGEGPGERVKATLRDPSGKVVEQKDDIEAHQFLVESPGSSTGAVWSLRLEKPTIGVLEDVYVELQGLPPVLSVSPEAALKPAG